jgi:hypothetical protein
MVNKKSTIKDAGDHNWDMERMQMEKEKGNITSDRDYVNKESKDISAAATTKSKKDYIEEE